MQSRIANPLDVLIVEDSETDARLVVHELRRSGFAPRWERVETAPALAEALRRRHWHLVISDSSVPRLGMRQALGLAKELVPDVPLVVVSGNASSQAVLEALDSGAADYVAKDELHRLGAVVTRELARPSAGAVREDERRRIAQHLHDEIGQLLTAALLRLETAQAQQGASRARTLRETRELIADALERVQRFSMELWPAILDRGLPAALRWLGDRYAKEVPVEVQADDAGPVAAALAIAAFRVAGESLRNAARHAGAKLVRVRLRAASGALELTVSDDGKGFDPNGQAGFGLAALRERVASADGTLDVDSAPGRGTTIQARFPISP